MIYISHRGNLTGKNIDLENTIDSINYCLSLGLHVEIDVWFDSNIFWLGHDEPKISVPVSFLQNTRLWCHAKNKDALFHMINNKYIHCFWHENDKYTITSKGIIWSYVGAKLNRHCVCVLPEQCSNYTKTDLNNCYGICSDNILKYKT